MMHVGNWVKVKQGTLSHFENCTGEIIRVGKASSTDIEVKFAITDRTGKDHSSFTKDELELA